MQGYNWGYQIIVWSDSWNQMEEKKYAAETLGALLSPLLKVSPSV